MQLSEEILKFYELAEEQGACLWAIDLAKKIGLRNLFIVNPDYEAWAVENIPFRYWPNEAVVALAEANPVRFGLILSRKAPELEAPRARLAYADLLGADLTDAYLKGACLRGAILSKANLSSAVLDNANLRYANLRGADLSDATLRGADLTGADLSDAKLNGTVF